jgi:dienelactone hydrolase/pimeloyl-ACP methyl ester carboxylesterase
MTASSPRQALPLRTDKRGDAVMLEQAQSTRTGPEARPAAVWLDLPTPTFGLYDAPSEPSHPLAVLFCAPLGWQDMVTYPVRRQWASALAAAGHPVLRLDLPGSGHSAGGAGDAALVAAWVAATGAAAAWLRAQGAGAVAAIGIDFGALLALHAAAQGAPIDDLVLWGMPGNGRQLVRRMRAFAALQAGASADGDTTLPEGWLQAGGFTFSAETLSDIAALRLDEPAPSAVRRALVLSTEGSSAVDERAAELLRGAGAQVTVADGAGYEEMHDSPHLVPLPRATIATCAAWLDAERAPSAREPGRAPGARAEGLIEHDGVALRERPFDVETPSGTMFGILAEPAEPGGGAGDLAVVCLPAMAERSIGPSRLWVEIARRQAARGVPTLRVDLLSIGDSDGDPGRMRDMRTIFDPRRDDEVGAVLDALAERTPARRFAFVGLCSGGHWALRSASADARVAQVLILNPSVGAEAKTYMMRAALRQPLRTLRDPTVLPRVRERGAATVLSGLRRELRRRLGLSRGQPPAPEPAPELLADPMAVEPVPGGPLVSPSELAGDYRRLGDIMDRRGGQVTFGIGQFEAAYWLLKLGGVIGRSRRLPGVSVSVLAGSDHNLRTCADQQAVHRLTDEMLAADAFRG